MIIATHEMGFAREVADEVCFLHDGRDRRARRARGRARRSAAARDAAVPVAAGRLTGLASQILEQLEVAEGSQGVFAVG